jgi:hypothetical protein
MNVVRYSDVTYDMRRTAGEAEGESFLSRVIGALTKPRTAPLASGQAQAKNSLVTYGVPIAVGIGAIMVIAAASK